MKPNYYMTEVEVICIRMRRQFLYGWLPKFLKLSIEIYQPIEQYKISNACIYLKSIKLQSQNLFSMIMIFQLTSKLIQENRGWTSHKTAPLHGLPASDTWKNSLQSVQGCYTLPFLLNKFHYSMTARAWYSNISCDENYINWNWLIPPLNTS